MNLHDRDITRAAKREGLAQGLRQGLSQGLAQGVAQGAQQKAVEAAVIAVKDFNITPQIAAEKMNAPLDKVLESLANTHL
jgi:flagellar biosynthesis/type III secretory pathway protein FliH